MALLNPPAKLESAVSMPPPMEFQQPPSSAALNFVQPAVAAAPARVSSSKVPRGRVLGGGPRAVYDVDLRVQGETKAPQLEVTPITKYVSDPELVLGRQIAVSKTYICYGLKLGAIRVLNSNTALRALLKGHTQRVVDMAFFAEDVDLLASASVDGRIFVWKIDEGPDDENMPQISGKVVTSIHFVGDQESYHPRICWHSHKQEILYVGIGNSVLRIDTIKIGRGKEFSAEEPLRCSLDKLIDGVHLIGKHNGEVTDLSISQWMTTRLASASKDGTLTIWDDRKLVPLATFKPHDGYAVGFVEFITSPHQPDHVNLVTAGPLNQEVKIWTSAGEEGWLLPTESESWQCTQTLELISSLEPKLEEAFFNQIVVLPQASLLIIANAKKNAIYAVHIDYGSCPASTRVDYIADFTVTMPILSLIGICDSLPDGEQVVQVYCVQTQAIQQYALDLIQCLPPLTTDSGVGKDPQCSGVVDESSKSSDNKVPQGGASPKPQLTDKHPDSPFAASSPVASFSSEVTDIHEYSLAKNEVKRSAPQLPSADSDSLIAPSPNPLCADLTGKLLAEDTNESSQKAPKLHDFDYLADKTVDTVTSNAGDAVGSVSTQDAGQNDISTLANSQLKFDVRGDVGGMINSSDIISGVPSSEISVDQCPLGEEVKGPDMIINCVESLDREKKIVGEEKLGQQDDVEAQLGRQNYPVEKKEMTLPSSEKLFLDNLPSVLDNSSAEEITCPKVTVAAAESIKPAGAAEEVLQNVSRDMAEIVSGSVLAVAPSFSPSSGDKKKQEQFQTSDYVSRSSLNSTGSFNEPGSSADASLAEVSLPQICALQESFNQFMDMQKEMQKQIVTLVASPVTKEGKRIEAALSRNMEKLIKANTDALWARFQEESAKQEKIEKDRMQQLTTLVTNCMNRDLPAMLERAFKKEISTIGAVLGRTIAPMITSAISESFQRGVGDKAVNQLEKSVSMKLEGAVAKQIQAQFQGSGKQVLQDVLKSCLESTVVPAFERSCKAAFEKVDSAFHKGFTEHAVAAQKQFEASHTPLAFTLRDAVNSASSITQNLASELIDGQHKILAIISAGNTKVLDPTAMQQINGPVAGPPEMLVEAPIDPTKELSRLVSENKYEEAFTNALQRSDVSIVSWLCSQVDLRVLCSASPPPLSQGVLLALLQQLACDLINDTARKVSWMTEVAIAINPADPMIAMHVRPIFEQVYNLLSHQKSLPTTTASEAANIRLIMHVINSVIMTCK